MCLLWTSELGTWCSCLWLTLVCVLCSCVCCQQANAYWQLARPTGNAAGDFSISPLNLGTVNSTVDVYVLPTDVLYTDAEVDAVLAWASYGRGIVVAGAAWNVAGFSGLSAKNLPANKVLRPFGLQVCLPAPIPGACMPYS